ncbi:MAG: hypothetical protein JAZ05_10380 [Candidatus Thiodiazotropha taylori]|nr:hypothetical protein [Candidatus Thiodiazotropha taylori]MCW4292422.1 hypothetical protein [Candidatus Thiodiazotropha taylori]
MISSDMGNYSIRWLVIAKEESSDYRSTRGRVKFDEKWVFEPEIIRYHLLNCLPGCQVDLEVALVNAGFAAMMSRCVFL